MQLQEKLDNLYKEYIVSLSYVGFIVMKFNGYELILRLFT